jgi:hypothetical protein
MRPVTLQPNAHMSTPSFYETALDELNDAAPAGDPLRMQRAMDNAALALLGVQEEPDPATIKRVREAVSRALVTDPADPRDTLLIGTNADEWEALAEHAEARAEFWANTPQATEGREQNEESWKAKVRAYRACAAFQEQQDHS